MSSISFFTITKGRPIQPLLKRKEAHRPDKLRRRVLPIYLKPGIIITSMTISLVGHVACTAAVSLSRVAPSWGGAIFATGIVFGFILGHWTARMLERDYMRVLTQEITFWEARGAKGTTIFVILALGMPTLFGLLIRQTYEILAGIESYIFGFVGAMNFALLLWVRRLPR